MAKLPWQVAMFLNKKSAMGKNIKKCHIEQLPLFMNKDRDDKLPCM
jgi:hypothetical protein